MNVVYLGGVVRTQADLIAFHKQRAAQLDSLISAVASQWPDVTQTGTGIRLEWLDRTPQATKVSDLPKGTVLELHHAFALLDDRVITSWQQDGPLAFELGATDLPTGFHEIIGSAALGDSVRPQHLLTLQRFTDAAHTALQKTQGCLVVRRRFTVVALLNAHLYGVGIK